MPIQILPRTPGIGERLATGLGTGLSTGVRALTNLKLKQLVQQQEMQQFIPLLRDYSPEEQEKIRMTGVLGGRREAVKTVREFEKTKQRKQEIIRRQAERKNKPQFDQLVKESNVAERALPVLKKMTDIINQLPTGLRKSFGKYLGDDALTAYNTLAEQLAAVTGIKPKGLPSVDLSPAKLHESIGNMITQYKDILLKKDTIEDIISENDNYMPSNLFQQADKRFKLRKHQIKKSDVKSLAPETHFPHLESEGKFDLTPDTPQEYQQEIAANAPLLQQAPIPEIPFGTTELTARTPSVMERIEETTGIPPISGPISRTVAEGLSGLGGGLGNILSMLGSLGSYATGGALPSYEEAQKTVPLPPTTEQIRRRVFGPALEVPEKGRLEQFAGNIAREAGELIGPGFGAGVLAKGIGKLANVPKWLKTAESFLKIAPKAAGIISTIGNTTEETLKELGASESVQQMGKLVTSLGASALTNRMAIMQASNLGKKITSTIKDAKPYTSYRLRDNLYELRNALAKGTRTPLKNQLMTMIKDIPSIKMPSEKLWNVHQLLDKIKDVPEITVLTKESIPKLIKQIEQGITYANKEIRPLMRNYTGLSSAKDASSRIYSSLGQLTRRNPLARAIMYSLGIYSAPRLFSKTGLSGLATLGLLGETEKSLRLMKNPIFYKKYGDLLKAGFASAAQQVAKAD